jgi:DNA primase
MTTTELALSVAAGGLFPVGLNGLGRTAKSTFNFLKGGKRGAEKVTNSLHAVEGQLENGKRVDTEDYVNAEMQKELPELEKELEAARKEADMPLPRDAVETDLADGPQKSAKKAAKKTAKKKKKKTAKKKTKKTAKKAAKVKELEERVETARNAPTPDRVESVRRHNSRESDLNYDPDIAETVKTNLDNPLLPEDITPELTRQFTELDERVSRMDIESLPEEIRIELDGARAEFNKVETVDKAFNAAENCVRSV